MNILTIQLGCNASALLAQNGRVIGIVSQERFNNIKNSNQFPSDAIDWLLTKGKIAYGDLDRVGVCGMVVHPEMLSKTHIEKPLHENHAFLYRLSKQLDYYFGNTKLAQALGAWRRLMFKPVLDAGLEQLKADLATRGVAPDKIVCVDHHDCHAYSPIAFFSKVTAPWLIFTADGDGDGISSTVCTWDGKELKRIASSPTSCSLGFLYGLTTKFMGMKMQEHEYKVMGLAAYAKEDYFSGVYNNIFKNILSFDPANPLVFSSRFPMTRMVEHLKKHAACGVRFDNLAGAVQHCLEQLVLQWVRNAIKQTGITRVMTSGGVFMNVKLNKLIREMPEVTDVRFMPSCGDETNPIGGAYALCKQAGIEMEPILSLYQGQSYTDAEIEAFLESHPKRDLFTFEHVDNMPEKIASMLAEHKVVARFAGRAEFGARSLGNRAIMAHPSDMQSFFLVNDQIKARDFWMPFAPSILDTDALRYLENKKNVAAPYMIDAFDTTPEGRISLRAAMHQADKSVRPQIVTREANADYYKMIEAFKAKTGVGAIMNTSFNLHGYPLASTMEQALFTMMNSDLEYLAMEGWMVSKKTA